MSHIIPTPRTGPNISPSIEIASLYVADMIEGETEYESTEDALSAVSNTIRCETRHIIHLERLIEDYSGSIQEARHRMKILWDIVNELEDLGQLGVRL